MLLTGEMIEPEDAERWGLVNRKVPENHLEETIMVLASKLKKKPRGS
jgi:enoyl-CoA hydratase/carnithine racemase